MFKKITLPALALGTALAVMSPATALARDHDRDHERHEWREHERHERREWRERNRIYGYGYYGPSYYYGPTYAYGPSVNGYYDRWGYWHPYNNYGYGYYDRWGRWHPY